MRKVFGIDEHKDGLAAGRGNDLHNFGRRIGIALAIIILVGLLLAACGPMAAAPAAGVPEKAQAGDLTGLHACEYQPAGSPTKYAAQCGTLVVPENWDKPDSRLIALPVVRVSASGPNPAEPVFWLEGGPGGTNFSWAPPAWLLEKHDFVVVGYRGVEGSVVLSCPEVGHLLKKHLGKDLWSKQARAEYGEAVKECGAGYQKAGVDLAGYTIPGVIGDVEAARSALGYDRINLLSVSYGTRIAQIYAYMHPNSLHRLVLIGVNTPGHFLYDRAVLDAMIGHLSELCAKDSDCNSRTPDLAETMYQVNHYMPRHWLMFNIDPDTLRLGTQALLFSNTSMPMIFDAYLAAANGDPSGLAMGNLIMSLTFPVNQYIFGDFFNKGGTVDLEKYGGIDSINLGGSILGAPFSELIWPMATAWSLELIPQDLREFQETDVEMLLVNGTVDFSTPPTALEEAKPYYHKAQIVLLPEFSHVNDVYELQPKAFERLITSYYDTGVADSSLFVYQPVSFKPSMSLTTLARLLVATMIVLPLVLILIIALVVRGIRRRRRVKA